MYHSFFTRLTSNDCFRAKFKELVLEFLTQTFNVLFFCFVRLLVSLCIRGRNVMEMLLIKDTFVG